MTLELTRKKAVQNATEESVGEKPRNWEDIDIDDKHNYNKNDEQNDLIGDCNEKVKTW